MAPTDKPTFASALNKPALTACGNPRIDAFGTLLMLLVFSFTVFLLFFWLAILQTFIEARARGASMRQAGEEALWPVDWLTRSWSAQHLRILRSAMYDPEHWG